MLQGPLLGKILILDLDSIEFPDLQSAIIFLTSRTVFIFKILKFVFHSRIGLRKILVDILSDVKMSYNIFSVLRFSHENSSDYEQNDWLNCLYTDTSFKCKSFKMPRFTNSRGLS